MPPPPEVPMGTQAVSAKQVDKERAVVPSFTVGGTDFTEPAAPIVTSIDGKDTITLRLPRKEVTIPIRELKLVAPKALQTKLGVCAGKHAVIQGNARTRNRAFYRNPRIACAAFTAYCARKCGRPGLSFGAHAQYSQLRRRGGRLVASKASTRYAPWYPYWRRGDYLFFWKSRNRIGHCEISVGGGWTVGTSSSAGYVARRRTGNRGFARMSVVRL
jgi:hypothetical protein